MSLGPLGVMKPIGLLFTFVTLGLAAIAKEPIGHSFTAELLDSGVMDDPRKTALEFRVDSDDALLHHIRIRCDSKTGTVIEAFWWTKGTPVIHLPKTGLRIPLRAPPSNKAQITFDRLTFKTAAEKPVTILRFRWIE